MVSRSTSRVTGAITRCALGMALVATCLAITNVRGVADADSGVDIEQWLQNRIDRMDPDDAYRHPDGAERAAGINVIRSALCGGDAPEDELNAIGFTEHTMSDTETGRSFQLLAAETGTNRSWGVVLIDSSAPLRQVIEVPHPRSDEDSALVGVDLYRAAPGSALLVAGTHRDAADGDADAAHNTETLFHAFADELGAETRLEVQPHGFAEDNLPDYDTVVSPGAAHVGGRHHAVDQALAARGFRNCVTWRTDECDDLAGTTNVQGNAAAERGSEFLHLELAPPLRSESDRRADLVTALHESWS